MAQLIKNLPLMWETWVRSLGWEDPLEKGKATHSSILTWRIACTIVHGVTKNQTRLSDFHFHLFISEHITFIYNIFSPKQIYSSEKGYMIDPSFLVTDYECRNWCFSIILCLLGKGRMIVVVNLCCLQHFIYYLIVPIQMYLYTFKKSWYDKISACSLRIILKTLQ